jgi:catechol 2,3-dioxygenase-like lactoylglutathione lyase family enzyme
MPPERSNHDRTCAPHLLRRSAAPEEGILVTLFITARSVARSRDFYSRVLGGTVVLDDYQPGDTTSIFLNLRVADIQACYEAWKEKGAEFVTPPIDREAEIRCYMRDPDGYLIEVGQFTGLLHGKLAAKRPEDLPG